MKRNKLDINIIGAIFGGAIGYTYWHYWGCENGCSIKSVWWRMTVYGLVLGYLLTSMISDLVFSETNPS